jgi:hypothetical protein
MGKRGRSSVLGRAALSPYTEEEEAYTTRRVPAARAAYSKRSVPSTFTALVGQAL